MSNKDRQLWPAILTFKRLFRGKKIAYRDDSSSNYKSGVDASFTLFSISVSEYKCLGSDDKRPRKGLLGMCID